MNVGDYVRTKDDLGIQLICKINKIISDDFISTDKGHWDIEDIIKSSPNIIDLIKVGDYVNGHRVNYINKDREHFNISFGDENFNLKSKFNSDIYWLSKEDIKSIVTREQFEAMQYKVGE